MTLDFEVICQGHAFGSSWIELPETLNIRKKTIFVATASVVDGIGKVTLKEHKALNLEVIRQSHTFGSS